MQHYIVSSLVYSGLGILILFLAFALIELMTPKHNLRKEIMENKNIAVAIFAGFFMIAIAIIIASAIHG
jgi:putative membrane protein